MPPKVYVSEEICVKAVAKLAKLMDLEDAQGKLVQKSAAEVLLKACQTQERYALQPQTPKQFEQHAKLPISNAKDLAQMTPEELLDLQQRMIAGVVA